MASNTATLAIQIISDATKAAKGFQQAQNQTSKLEQRMRTANRVAIVTAGSLIAVGAAGLKQASELQQSSGAIKATFGAQSKAVAELAKKAAEAQGLSRSSYQQLASVFGAQLKNMGVAADQLVPKTDQLITLGADLAATYGGTTADAVAAIGSLLRGERDPIEKYAVGIKQADINARLAAQGQDKLTGAAKKTAETQATLALLTKQTTSAQGTFAEESDTAAGATQRMQAKLDNVAASMTTILLPAVTAISTGIASLATFTEKHTTASQIAIGVLAGLAAAVLTVNAAMKVYKATQVALRVATIVMRNAQLALNLAMIANPVGLIVAAVVLLVAGLVLAYKKSETFRNIVQAAGRAGQDAIGWVVDKVKDLWEWVQKLIGKIKDIDWPSPPSWVTKILGGDFGELFSSYRGPGLSAAGAGYALAPAVFTAPGELKASGPELMLGRMGRGGPSVISITVNGALDPDSVARQIEGLLAGRNRRLGRFS